MNYIHFTVIVGMTDEKREQTKLFLSRFSLPLAEKIMRKLSSVRRKWRTDYRCMLQYIGRKRIGLAAYIASSSIITTFVCLQ